VRWGSLNVVKLKGCNIEGINPSSAKKEHFNFTTFQHSTNNKNNDKRPAQKYS
jgi:hypothetical protein